MRLTYLNILDRILEKIDAGYLDTSWKTRASQMFHKNIIKMIAEKDYTEDELFGLIQSITITLISETAYAFLGNVTIGSTTILALEILRIDDTTKTYRFRKIDYDEYQKRITYTGMNIDTKLQYYAIKGNSIYVTGKTAIESPGVEFNVTYVSDLPSWTDTDYPTDVLGLSLIYRAIDKTAAEVMDIYNRSA